MKRFNSYEELKEYLNNYGPQNIGYIYDSRGLRIPFIARTLKSGYWFDSELKIERSLYVEDNLYTISQE